MSSGWISTAKKSTSKKTTPVRSSRPRTRRANATRSSSASKRQNVKDSKKSWKIGDDCFAPFEGDYFRATVVAFPTKKPQKVTVAYDDYPEDGLHDVGVAFLKKNEDDSDLSESGIDNDSDDDYVVGDNESLSDSSAEEEIGVDDAWVVKPGKWQSSSKNPPLRINLITQNESPERKSSIISKAKRTKTCKTTTTTIKKPSREKPIPKWKKTSLNLTDNNTAPLKSEHDWLADKYEARNIQLSSIVPSFSSSSSLTRDSKFPTDRLKKIPRSRNLENQENRAEKSTKARKETDTDTDTNDNDNDRKEDGNTYSDLYDSNLVNIYSSSSSNEDDVDDGVDNVNTDVEDDKDDVLDIENGSHKRKRKTETSKNRKRRQLISVGQQLNDMLTTQEDKDEKPDFGIEPCSSKEPYILDEDCEINPYVSQYLRVYQKEGVEFLYRHYKKGTGALLADEMGLGKTVQIISFLCAIFEKKGTFASDTNYGLDSNLSDRRNVMKRSKMPPVLVVCPKAVLHNWNREFEAWGYFNVFIVEKSSDIDTMIRICNEGSNEIVIGPYNTLSNNVEKLNQVDFACAIFDEVHLLKNDTVQLYVKLNRLKCQKRFGLSGTPVQNNLMELWSVSNFLNDNILRSKKEFKSKFSEAIKSARPFDVNNKALSAGTAAKAELSRILKIFVLRREKSMLIKELPEKIDQVVFCKPTSRQISAYEIFKKSSVFQELLIQSEPCDCGRKDVKRNACCHVYLQDSDIKTKDSLLACFGVLSCLANHLALLHPKREEMESEVVCPSTELKNKCFEKFPRCVEEISLTDLEDSGKLQVLHLLLDKWKQAKAEKNKVLLFSLSTRTLDILEEYVKKENYSFCRLDGTTPAKKRLELVDNFNNQRDKFIFLISTKAGGVGLNLTSANKVVIFDPSWNPTQDMQAQDRAYRIGQRRAVNVYRLIGSSSIEETIYARQIYKTQLAHVAQQQGSNPRRFFADKEIFGVKTLLCFSEGLSQKYINRTLNLEDKFCIQDNKLANTKTTANPKDQNDDVDTNTQDEEEEEFEQYTQSKALLDDLAEDTRLFDHAKLEAKKSDAIDNLLENCGASVLQNKDVFGTSTFESRITAQATDGLASETDNLALYSVVGQRETEEKTAREEERELVTSAAKKRGPGRRNKVSPGLSDKDRRAAYEEVKQLFYPTLTKEECALKIINMTDEEREAVVDAYNDPSPTNALPSPSSSSLNRSEMTPTSKASPSKNKKVVL